MNTYKRLVSRVDPTVFFQKGFIECRRVYVKVTVFSGVAHKQKLQIAVPLKSLTPETKEEVKKVALSLKQITSEMSNMFVVTNVIVQNSDQTLYIFCDVPIKQSIGNYYSTNKVFTDEKMSHVVDLLNMYTALSQLQKDETFETMKFLLSEEDLSLALMKNVGSPFTQISVTPLAFIVPLVFGNLTFDPYNVVIANLLEKISEKGKMENLITKIRNNESVKEILGDNDFVTQCLTLTNVPPFSFDAFEQDKSLLGQGVFGIVMKAQRKSDKKVFAIKESKKEKTLQLKKEAQIMRLCHHPNIIECFGFTELNVSIGGATNPLFNCDFPHGYICLEYCQNGNLESFVKCLCPEGDRLPLETVQTIFGQIASACRYLYFEKGIIHRDIKLDNFLVSQTDPFLFVKMIDFGWSRSIAEEMESVAGAPMFCAPEIIFRQPYSAKSDLYSLGVVLYFLLNGNYPFNPNNVEELRTQYSSSEKLSYSDKITKDIENKDVIDLINKMIVFKEDDRISWEEFDKHPFMVNTTKRLTELYTKIGLDFI
ncbi:serine/threonine protein kinase 17A, putative [Entamoeba invadens IP1]|uniref:serine/threonine protein kinase 17A, putative n=1 Tax=Entamoeba invadens IP1 TaxID=370355 RepID=UPI0002C3F712|nr:serine/threonine protein kinase 17A, putative [Entamoeba invadens IP1]ELP93263.1 serine/threonine protein kinase 17A, putative [Entamoeba invadens IP1]|eukprot:XP_004260034.1 serine/threonine protein kinase 17A, putative [Entamoeba invadens IP1]